jgi:hypothetical protein
MTEADRTCDACGKPPTGNQKLLSCSRCKKAWYHDRDCQQAHFKKHKLVCKQLATSTKKSSPENGIQVVDTKSAMGRVVIATKDFIAGDIVLSETPAIVFDDQVGYNSLWDAYLKAPPDKQKEVLEMQADSVAGDKEINDQITSDLRTYNEQMDPSLARNLVEIALINAHAFQPEGTGSYSEHELSESKAALFTMGSKIEHSCAPNISFETSPTGLLEYVTEMPIAKKQRLSISYQSHVYEESRQHRRQNIRESKGFLCQCSRCLSLDECSPLNCSHCQQKGTLFQRGVDNSWMCQACDWKGDAAESIENQIKEQELLSQKLDGIKMRLQSSGFNSTMIMECCIIQNVIASKLSPLHWLYPKVYHSLRVVATSQARFLMRNKHLHQTDPSVVAMLQLAGKSQLEHFHWLSRNISLVHGTRELQEVCQNADQVDSLQENTLRSKADIEPFLDSIIESAESSFNINSQTVSLIFYAGLDLLLAGHTERVAKMFESFKDMFSQWKILSPENRKRIQILIKSKGKRNPFPNHIIS